MSNLTVKREDGTKVAEAGAKNVEKGDALTEAVVALFTPGVSGRTVAVLNWSLIGLVLVMFGMAVADAVWGGKEAKGAWIHYAVLCFLAVGLFVSANWYVDEKACTAPKNMSIDSPLAWLVCRLWIEMGKIKPAANKDKAGKTE